ncbi:hypothetical protein YC2023_041051 [Brassica napus]
MNLQVPKDKSTGPTRSEHESLQSLRNKKNHGLHSTATELLLPRVRVRPQKSKQEEKKNKQPNSPSPRYMCWGQNRSRRNQCLKVPGKPTLDRSLKTRHSRKTVNQVKDSFSRMRTEECREEDQFGLGLDRKRGSSQPRSGRPAPRSAFPWTRMTLAEVTSPMGEDDPRRERKSQPRSPRPWARTTRAEVTSPMGEDDPRRGHLAHGRGRPAPRSSSPEVTTPIGEDDPRRGHLAHGRG